MNDSFDDEDEPNDDDGLSRDASGRWKKGHSGNQSGRPRKPKQPDAGRSPDELTDDMVLREAARLIPIGEKGEKLTSHELVFRATLNKAIKGSPHAQRLALEIIEGAKTRKFEKTMSVIKNYLDIRDRGYQSMANAKSRGEPEPYLVPHPDDIFFDLAHVALWVYGPLTQEQDAIHEELKNRLEVLKKGQVSLRRRLKRVPDDTETIEDLAKIEPMIDYLETLNFDRPNYFGVMDEDQVPRPMERAEYHEHVKRFGPPLPKPDIPWKIPSQVQIVHAYGDERDVPPKPPQGRAKRGRL